MNHFDYLRQAILKILTHVDAPDAWTIQGLGMLRLYLSPWVRLHIWDRDAVVPDVSKIHTHPWDLKSTVINGAITDFIYVETPTVEPEKFAFHVKKQKLLCGESGGLVDQPEACMLRRSRSRLILTGQTYGLAASEIHESYFTDGTVTLIERKFTEDPDHAFVYWDSKEWVSAEPRIATEAERDRAVTKAIKAWRA